MRVFISDPVNREAISYLEKNSLEVYYQPEIEYGDLLKEIVNYQAILVRSRTKVTAEILNKGKSLKVVGRIGSGYDNIDIEECRARRITVINAPDANSQAVAELTIGLIIALLRKEELAFSSMRKGQWLKNEIWGAELSGKTVGIVGYGFVGKKVANILSAFGCKILIYSRSYQTASLDELFSASDLITIHLALTKGTEGLISSKLLNKMKKTACLINIARGKIFNEDDLYDVLINGKIAGAALDVYWQEPLEENSKWRKLDNVILTPHIGAATREALSKASITVVEDLVRIYKGQEPKYQVI